MLQRETKIYQYLQGQRGFPSVLWFGYFENYYYMALPLLGNSLTPSSTDVNATSVCLLGVQMVERIQSLHNKGLIHRDIKTDNFLFGLSHHSQLLYLIDFGFCRRYLLADGTHILKRTNKSIVGTPNYISIDVHEGCEPSRRDDLESVAYILYYLYYNVRMGTKEMKIERMTDSATHSALRQYWNMCRNIAFEETPRYDELIRVLS